MTNRAAFQEVRNLINKRLRKSGFTEPTVLNIFQSIQISIIRIKKPYTVVELKHGVDTSIAFAKVNPGQDVYSESRGLEIATGKAMKGLCL